MVIKNTDFKAGIIDAIPICIAFVFVSLSMGALSRQAGLTGWQTASTGLFIYATPLQVVLLTFLNKSHHLLLFIVITLTINFRFFLMSSALAPYFNKLPFYKLLFLAFFISASSFTVAHVKFTHNRHIDHYSYFLSMSGISYLVSFIALMIGYYSHQLIHLSFLFYFLSMTLPIHFIGLTALRWPRFDLIFSTLIGFCLMPILSIFSIRYALVIIPILSGLVMTIYKHYMRNRHV